MKQTLNEDGGLNKDMTSKHAEIQVHQHELRNREELKTMCWKGWVKT